MNAATGMNNTVAGDMGFGSVLLHPGRTRFRFWAPDCQEVWLEIENAGAAPMLRDEAGWFTAEIDCGAGTLYRYRVAPDLSVPDPASRAQHGDVFDASVVVDPKSYVWRNTEWRGRPWHETVVYEMHIGLMGGFREAMKRLPEIAAVGVTAVEMMPVGDFAGTRNWGYDGVLPYAPDAVYGAPDDLKAFIDCAHGLGLMVFLDVVYNHFGPEGNYLHHYASPFFRNDIKTLWGPAINFAQQEVREFFIGNALYWLQDFRFDGLRIDAAHAFYAPDMLDDLAARARAAAGPLRHIHLMLEHDGNVASHLQRTPDTGFDAQWNDDAHHALHVLLSDETVGYYSDYANGSAEQLARALREGFIYQGQPSPYRKGLTRGEPSAHLPPTAFMLFLQSHDQMGNRPFGERLSALSNPDALRAAVAMQLLCPHIPMIFMGEEWGSTQPFHYFTDHRDELANLVREGRHDEFATFPDFADALKRHTLPDPNALDTFLTSVPNWDEAHHDSAHAQWLACYKMLLALRQRAIVPRLPGAAALGSNVLGPKAVTAQWRMGDGQILSLTVNLAPQPVRVAPQPAIARDQLLFESRSSAADALTNGFLQPFTTIASLVNPP